MFHPKSSSLAMLVVWGGAFLGAFSLGYAEDVKLANPGFEQASGQQALGWTESYWFKTPPQEVSVTQEEKRSGRSALKVVLKNPITEVGYNEGGFQISLSQKLPKVDPTAKLRISFWYKTQSRIPMEVALSGGSGCERPCARTGSWLTDPGKDWVYWERELEARQFSPVNSFYKGAMWLEIMISGQASPLPATLYLDDVRIEVVQSSTEKVTLDPSWSKRVGNLCDQIQAIRRSPWSVAKWSASSGRGKVEDIDQRQLSWLDELASRQAKLASDVKDLRTPTRLQRDAFEAKLSSVETLVGALRDGRLLALKDLVLYQVEATSNCRILPKDANIPGRIVESVAMTAAGNEYEAASFALQARAEMKDLCLDVSPFRSEDGRTLASITPDIRIVKCWYQDEAISTRLMPPDGVYNPIDRGGFRQLMPELLLYDDSLVSVDFGSRDNYVRGSFADGDRYINVSRAEGVVPGNELKDFPVTDAASLRPITFPAGQNRQFWITVHVPAGTPSGEYYSTVSLKSSAGEQGSFRISLTILPFSLPAPFAVNSIFYRYPSPQFYGDKVWEQFRAEIRNLLAHGVDIPVLYTLFPLGSSRQGLVETAPPFAMKEVIPFDPTGEGADLALILRDLEYKLKILREEGVSSENLFLDGLPVGHPEAAAALAILEERVRAVVDLARRYDFKEVYFYGIDEARRSVLERQRPAWEAVHRAGGRIFSSGSTEQLPVVGDLLDLSITILPPEKSVAQAWHDRGHLVAAYGNPQGGVEQPDTYRRNFGILLWQADFDGAMTYLYHNATIQNSKGVPADANTISWASSWNDFCPNPDQTKQHNMVYPTAVGVLDTIQWEGYREGLDDVRYLRVLEAEIQKAASPGLPPIVAARSWLDALKHGHLNRDSQKPAEVRKACIAHILAISQSARQTSP